MTFRNKIYFTIFAIVEFIAVLFVLGVVAARAAENSDDAAVQAIVMRPEHEMSLVSFDSWVVEGELLGSVATYVYTDVKTERSVDYWELYDKDGGLLAFRWFDAFGIPRTAVDRGILEQRDELEGIFVIISGGYSM